MATLSNLTRAFSMATRASESEKYDNAARAIFRAIARQIWLSLGDDERPLAVKEFVTPDTPHGDTLAALEAEDDSTLVRVEDLKFGMLCDLEGDKYADPAHDQPEYEFEYAMVDQITREGNTITVEFHNGACGFPLGYQLKVEKNSKEVTEDPQHCAECDEDIDAAGHCGCATGEAEA